MFSMKYLKTIKRLAWAAFTYILLINSYVNLKTKGFVFNNVCNTPANKVGLILGTGKYTANGQVNLYYKHRLNGAVALFKAGKIEYILVSGDNSSVGYNEPMAFKKDLIHHGIPEDKIVLDFAGFRTLDSVVRAKQVFHLESVTIISQKFHNQRALFLAKHFDIKAIAYNAKAVNGSYGYKTELREFLARTKASLDIILNVKPKFLGKPIPIV